MNLYLKHMRRSKTTAESHLAKEFKQRPKTGSALLSYSEGLWQNNKTPILATVIGIPVILLGIKFYRRRGIETIEQEDVSSRPYGTGGIRYGEGSANELTMESFIEDIDGGESILTLTEDIEEPEGSSNQFVPDFEEIVEEQISFEPSQETESQISSTSFQF